MRKQALQHEHPISHEMGTRQDPLQAFIVPREAPKAGGPRDTAFHHQGILMKMGERG